MRTFLPLVALTVVVSGCATSRITTTVPVPADPTSTMGEGTATIVLASEVEWQQLNPARGDKSPLAATLWGDRNDDVATGFLVRFVDGFESPPHIHNVSYRGVVVHGLVHNDDPNADAMWMPAGSFWTQPKGGVHITSAKGSEIVAYIEIDEGPYLVRPTDEALSNGEQPVNVAASNIVWVDASPGGGSAHSEGSMSTELQVAYLWGDPSGDQLGGIFIKLAAGATAVLGSHSARFRAVVIHGRLKQLLPDQSDNITMEPSSYFSSDGGTVQVSCEASEDCIVYVRKEGRFNVK